MCVNSYYVMVKFFLMNGVLIYDEDVDGMIFILRLFFIFDFMNFFVVVMKML